MKIVAEVKPPKAVPNENEDVLDSELQNSLLFDDDSDNNEDDLLAAVLPNRNDCNMDLVYKELDKDPKFRNVSKWLKGIEGNLILPTIEPVVQTIVPGFLSTESMGNAGVATNLRECVSPQTMGNVGAGTKLPGFAPTASVGNVGAGSKLPEFVPTQTMGNVGVGTKLPGFAPTFSQIPKQPTSKSVTRFRSLNAPNISRHKSETQTTSASFPLTSASLPVDNLDIEII